MALGFPNVIPCYGANGFTEGHRIAFTENLVHTVIVAFDNDEAGKKGAEGLCEKLRDQGMAAATAYPPSGKDWNDYLVAKGDPNALKSLFDEARAAATANEDEALSPRVTKEGKRYTFSFPEIVYRVVIANESFGSSLRPTSGHKPQGSSSSTTATSTPRARGGASPRGSHGFRFRGGPYRAGPPCDRRAPRRGSRESS